MRGFANQRNPYDDLIIQNESAEERERILEKTRDEFKKIKKYEAETRGMSTTPTKAIIPNKFTKWFKCLDEFMFSHVKKITAANEFPLLISDESVLRSLRKQKDNYFEAIDTSQYEEILQKNEDFRIYQDAIQKCLVFMNQPFILPTWNPAKRSQSLEFYVNEAVMTLLRRGVDIYDKYYQKFRLIPSLSPVSLVKERPRGRSHFSNSQFARPAN